MKKLLWIVVLGLLLNISTKADDIRDFEIEGMSIGDSLLDFFSKKEIDNLEKAFYPSSKNYYLLILPINNLENYDNLIANLKNNDKSYYIHSISGAIDTYRDTKKCLAKQKEIKGDIMNLFPNIEYKDYTFVYPQDTIGESKATITDFEFEFGEIRVFCTDWSKEREDEKNSMDNVQVVINSEDMKKFLTNEAYK
tara:strand:- start:417 stop:1001 length:585 start_codon:yes stop_codon:yes gene_type:complete